MDRGNPKYAGPHPGGDSRLRTDSGRTPVRRAWMFRSREPRVETSSIATLVGEERPVTSVAVSRTKHESLQRMATQRVSGSQHRFLVSDRAGANTPILPQLARQLTPAIKAAKNAVPSSGVHSAEAPLASIRCKLPASATLASHVQNCARKIPFPESDIPPAQGPNSRLGPEGKNGQWLPNTHHLSLR